MRDHLLAQSLPSRFRSSFQQACHDDAAPLGLGEHLRLPRFGFVAARIEVGDRLPVVVSDGILPGILAA
jgi:hypothetical protein